MKFTGYSLKFLVEKIKIILFFKTHEKCYFKLNSMGVEYEGL